MKLRKKSILFYFFIFGHEAKMLFDDESDGRSLQDKKTVIITFYLFIYA